MTDGEDEAARNSDVRGVPAVLRHTTASVWLAAGADPKVVQRVLGHATASMTMDLYGHLVDGNLWQAARMVGGISGAAESPEPHDQETEDPEADGNAW